MSYKGHLPGSGVQRHSAGDVFPWIIEIVETGGRDRRYVATLGDLRIPCRSHTEAEQLARWSNQRFLYN